jgi:HYR domain-containing protein
MARLALAVALAAAGAMVAQRAERAEGGARPLDALTFRAVIGMRSAPRPCPGGLTATTACFEREGAGVVRGLGRVVERYTFLADTLDAVCGGLTKVLPYPVQLAVDGKGDIILWVADPVLCLAEDVADAAQQTFTVEGGTGVYAGATGSGHVERTFTATTSTVRTGTDTWVGTLTVPGLEFDVTPPRFQGATAKTVRLTGRAQRARVRYGVTARDAVDGRRPVVCTPRSGSLFRPGTRTVACSASDTSGNAATVRFRVTVRRR